MIDNGNFLRNFAPEIPQHFQKQLNNSVKYYAAIRYIKQRHKAFSANITLRRGVI